MERKDKIREIVFYLIFGVLTTIVNLVVFGLLKKAGVSETKVGFAFTNIVAWIAAVTFAFFTNRTYVFKSEAVTINEIIEEATKFVGGRLFSGLFEIILPLPLTLLFKEGFKFSLFGKEIFLDDQWLAKLVTSVVVIILNYVISKFIVFKKKKENEV